MQASRDAIIEATRLDAGEQSPPFSVVLQDVVLFVQEYLDATNGLVDLFDRDSLFEEMNAWASSPAVQEHNATDAVFFLVVAIGAQDSSENNSEAWFKLARDVLTKHMCNSMSVATVQGFVLVAIYMLRAFQPNGAYLYFCMYRVLCERIYLTISSIGSSYSLRNRYPPHRSQCIFWPTC
jgi:hypothetical protein